MTSLCLLLKQVGLKVSGSDLAETFPTDEVLHKYKIPLKIGFQKSNLPANADLVIVTGAHGGLTNIEAVEAKKRGIETLMHGQALGMVMDKATGISIAGCHGKTTTTAMLATILEYGGRNPSYAIGAASINPLGAPGHFGHGEYFIAEADEYLTDPFSDKTPRFLWQNPKVAVVTNIEFDHPDAYANIDQVRSAFTKFSQKVPHSGLLVAGTDNPQVTKMIKTLSLPVATFGFSPQSEYQIKNTRPHDQKTYFHLSHQNIDLGEFILQIPGKHNVLNAAASIIVANFLGLSINKIKDGLHLFLGTKRRFEKIGDFGGVLLYDDYAHHPSEIIATLSAAKDFFAGRRIFVIFQPHTYSRTKALLKDFARAFYALDNITIITDIFPSSREIIDKSYTSEVLVQEILKYKNSAHFLPKKEDVLGFLEKNIRSGDIIFTMGAGDIYQWHQDILKLTPITYD